MSRNALFAGKNVCMPARTFSRAGIPGVAHPISKCDTCTLFDHHTSGLYNKDTCHNVTIPPASSCCIPGLPSCNLTSATPIMTDLLMPRMFYWCMENHAPASTTLGEIPRERCSFVIERRTEFDVYVTTSDTKEENELKECLYGNPSLPKLFAINQWLYDSSTDWHFVVYVGLLSTASYPANSMAGAPWFMSYQPSEKIHTPPSSSPHLQNSASTNKDGCIPGFTCVQTWWSRTSWCINPIVWCHAALDQVRSLSESVQKLANDTVLALGNIKDTLASHKMMILQNRVALDTFLQHKGEPVPLSVLNAAPG